MERRSEGAFEPGNEWGRRGEGGGEAGRGRKRLGHVGDRGILGLGASDLAVAAQAGVRNATGRERAVGIVNRQRPGREEVPRGHGGPGLDPRHRRLLRQPSCGSPQVACTAAAAARSSVQASSTATEQQLRFGNPG